MPTRSPSRPRQARSRQTEQRILAAAVELLGERPAEELSVSDIAKQAQVSIGGFYARFSSKGALFEHLYSGVVDGIVAETTERLSPAATVGLDARAVIRLYIELGVGAFRRHGVLLRQISLRSRTSRDPELGKRIQRVNQTLHDHFRQRLYERLAEMAHPSPKRAIDIALTSVSAAMREYVLFQDLRPQYAPIEDEALVAELTDLFCTYVRVE